MVELEQQAELCPKSGRNNMLNLSLSIGPVNAQMQTDEKLTFEGIETLLNRTMMTTLTLFNGHMGAMVKYDQLMEDEDHDCEACAIENNINLDEEI
jgi:hypothetical protein